MIESDKYYCYDNFPLSIVAIRLINLAAIMITGTALMYYYHPLAMVTYLVTTAISLYSILILVCRFCYYHGRRCDLALGLISGLIFRDDSNDDKFSRNAPRTYPFLALMILPPVIVGIIISIQQHSTIVLLILITYCISVTTLIISARELSCPHCKMKGICPFCTLPASERING